MCVYCMVGDEFFGSPKPPIWWPEPAQIPVGVPIPAIPPPPDYTGWDLHQLRDLLDILESVKRLEDSLACPCTPAKADYISIVKKRIRELEDIKYERCPDCTRNYRKPAGSHHTRVQCLEIQLADEKARASRGFPVGGSGSGGSILHGPAGENGTGPCPEGPTGAAGAGSK